MTQHDDPLNPQQSKASISLSETSHEAPPRLSQEEMKRRYLEQQRRLACPGCAEEPFLS